MKPSRTADSLSKAWKRSGASLSRFVTRLDRQGVPYLSHSKLTCIERCPRCYHRQYVLCEREESTAMLTGTLFHMAAKGFYESFRTGALPKPNKLLNGRKTKTLPQASQQGFRNALTLLRAHHWEGHEVLSLEEPFFMDLAADLPPVIGIPDLVLRRKGSLLVVDHKTCKSFNDLEPAQLVLYAQHLRQQHKTESIVGVFDEYRLVPDLSKIKKPAFRRTPVSVDHSLLPALVRRYRQAWRQIVIISHDGEPSSSSDCWSCNTANGWQNPNHHYAWNSRLAQAVQENEKAEPEFIVTDDFAGAGRQRWPWSKRWTNFNAWAQFSAYALQSRRPSPIKPDTQLGTRTVIIRQAPLTPQTLGNAQAVVIDPDLHRQFKWPETVKLIVLSNEDYAPDPRTARMNPRFKAAPLCWLPMEQALDQLDRMCKSMRVQRVASVALGFEDEGLALRAGTIQRLTFHLDLPGNAEAFGPYADGVE